MVFQVNLNSRLVLKNKGTIDERFIVSRAGVRAWLKKISYIFLVKGQLKKNHPFNALVSLKNGRNYSIFNIYTVRAEIRTH